MGKGHGQQTCRPSCNRTNGTRSIVALNRNELAPDSRSTPTPSQKVSVLVAPVDASITNGPYLTIDRRCKGRKAPSWELLLNGSVVTEMSNDDELSIGSIKENDLLAIRPKEDTLYYGLLLKHIPSNKSLTVGLKPTCYRGSTRWQQKV